MGGLSFLKQNYPIGDKKGANTHLALEENAWAETDLLEEKTAWDLKLGAYRDEFLSWISFR